MSSSSRPRLNLSPYEAIEDERDYQNRKWGVHRTHTWAEWMLILSDEFGEAARAAKNVYWVDGSGSELRSELIQVAAVAVAMIEQLDRDRFQVEAATRKSTHQPGNADGQIEPR
jgi:hypothetical protein